MTQAGKEAPATEAHRIFVKAASSAAQSSAAGQSADGGTNSSPSQQQRMNAYASGCPVVGAPGGAAAPAGYSAGGGGCPVVGINSSNQMAPSPNAPLPGQDKPLSTWRQESSIPTGADAAAAGAAQPGASGRWVYPSEQMFYNAMRRKGWSPTEDDMTTVVAIHNAVNERAWREILHWEAAAGGADACGGPRLIKFRGRPQDFSPKARLLNLLGYKLPFDRHDWVVDRCGREVRYVIDFYNAAPLPSMPTAMHLDVRPALDSPAAVWERVRMQWGWVASGRWRRG